MTSNLECGVPCVECGASAPLLAGRLDGRLREPRLAVQSGVEPPHSTRVATELPLPKGIRRP